MKMHMVAIIKYRLCPILSTKRPKGALKDAATIYVIMMACPAEAWVKQNRLVSILLALSKKGT